MTGDPDLIAQHRPERDLAPRWGIYSEREKRWLDVHFTTRDEAEFAIRILTESRSPSRRRP